MDYSILTPESPEVVTRLEEMASTVAHRYTYAVTASRAEVTADGELSAASIISIDRIEETQLELAFVADAIARIKPHYRGVPELFWVCSAKELLAKYAPGMELARFLSDDNQAEQREIYENMASRVVELDGENPTSPWYTCRVAMGWVALRSFLDEEQTS